MKRNDNRIIIEKDVREEIIITTPGAEGLPETSFIVDNFGAILVNNDNEYLVEG